MRTRARKFRVGWHFELDDEGLGYCTLDTLWAALDLFLERLERDLPTAAEALGTGGNQQPGAGWPSASCARCHAGGTTGETAGTTPSGLRLASKPDPLMIFVLYPDKRDADLRPRLAVTMDVMAGWLMEEVPAEVALEELHTAAELERDADPARCVPI